MTKEEQANAAIAEAWRRLGATLENAVADCEKREKDMERLNRILFVVWVVALLVLAVTFVGRLV